MTGFNLFSHLHVTLTHNEIGPGAAVEADTQLWDVALKSQSTDVSLAAIDYLNNCYMTG